MAKVTLYGFTQYYKQIGQDLWKNFKLPSGIDRETVINNILITGGEFETLHANPEFIQEAMGVWSKKWNRTFEKWNEALKIEYNPLENYNRIEDWTDTNTNKGKSQDDISSGSKTKIDNNRTDHSIGTSDTVNKISAFNSSEFENDNTSDQQMENTNNITDDNEINAESSEDRKNSYENSGNTIHKGRLHGNIGVTTSQQMLESELQIAEWNLIEKITDIFLNEFTIQVYY